MILIFVQVPMTFSKQQNVNIKLLTTEKDNSNCQVQKDTKNVLIMPECYQDHDKNCNNFTENLFAQNKFVNVKHHFSPPQLKV